MEFSNRDNQPAPPICCPAGPALLRSQKGQGTIEYVLVLVVGVAIVLGLLYQLNSAFKTWANNYFGDYLTCLLETGDLPSIGGSPGDTGICEQFFQPFTWAGGRPSNGQGPEQGEQDRGGPGAGARESGGGGGSPVRSGGGGGGSFGRSGLGTPTRVGRKIAGNTTFTGNTDASGYGGGYTTYQRPVSKLPKTKLDKRFAFQNEQERQTRKPLAATTKKDEGGIRGAIKLKPKKITKTTDVEADTSFSIGNFIRIIIIICIVLALLLFIGSQVMQISKSMD